MVVYQEFWPKICFPCSSNSQRAFPFKGNKTTETKLIANYSCTLLNQGDKRTLISRNYSLNAEEFNFQTKYLRDE